MDAKRIVLLFTLLYVGADTSTARAGDPPLGTEFSYQGQLRESEAPLNGPVDFEFRLFSQPKGGSPVSGTLELGEVLLVNGLFTVQLDFGATTFNDDARWLEVAVRRSAEEPGEFITLSPRQPITATPYALKVPGIDGHSLNAADGSPTDAVFVDPFGRVGIGTTQPGFPLSFGTSVPPAMKLAIYDNPNNAEDYGFGIQPGALTVWAAGAERMRLTSEGNVGIGTVAPGLRLTVVGGTDAAPTGGGFIQTGLTGSANIVIDDNEIMARSGGAPSDLFLNREGRNLILSELAGSVGIGTVTPQSSLHVNGGIRARGGPPGGFGVNNNGYAFSGNGGDNDSGMFSTSDGRVTFYTNGGEHLGLEARGTRVYMPCFGDFHNVQWQEFGDFADHGLLCYDDSTRRHKENIASLHDDFERLLSAQPVTYTRPGRPDRWEIGYIAEDLHDLGLTKLVQYGKEGLAEAVNYEKSVLYLVEIAKTQRSQLAGQQTRLVEQDTRFEALAAENAELRTRLERIEKALGGR